MLKITDDDLLIEGLLQGAGNMSDILKEIQTQDIARQLECLYSFTHSLF